MTRGGSAIVRLWLCAFVSACSARGVVGITLRGDDATSDASVQTSAVTNEPEPDSTSNEAAFESDTPIATPDAGSAIYDECLPVNPANVDVASAQRLVDESGLSDTLELLYPYSGTVYPQGIPGPNLMWDGPTADVVYVRLRSKTFDYRGCLLPTGPNRVDVPKHIWDLAATATTGAEDPYTLEVKVLAGDEVHGPITSSLVIAPGVLQGSVYYMTTRSSALSGAIVRLDFGMEEAKEVLAPLTCAGCHSVSAPGSRLLAYASGMGTSLSLNSGQPTQGTSALLGAEFAAVHPAGNLYVASAHGSDGIGPRSYGAGVTDAALYDANSGALVADSSIPPRASMPVFSPDGKQLAFTDLGESQGKTIGLIQFSAERRTASDYRALYSSSETFCGWPTFLPDGRAVVFTQGSSSDFSGGGAGLDPLLNLNVEGPPTDLYLISTAGGPPILLAQAAGFRSETDVANHTTYLPGGVADTHQSYYPSSMPVVSGGYAWLFFDSTRTYGNLGRSRAIWGAALTVSPDGSYSIDPSHPAFYVPAQDPSTPNFRAVAVARLNESH